MVAILGYSRKQIFIAVRDMYTAVADSPTAPYHFPVGRRAARLLGYPAEWLTELPETALASFAGVGFPFRANAIRPGDTVLDIGSGAGCDTLIASRLVGRRGRVIAVDMTPAMARKLRVAAEKAGAGNVHVIEASAERLPLADCSVDAITSNGVLNLVPDKRRAVAEMFRVLRPRGRVQFADIVINRPVTVDCRSDPALWVECVVGATVEEDLLQLFRDAGFRDLQLLHSLDYFSHSPSAQTRQVAASFRARTIEVKLQRGERAPARVWRLLVRFSPRRLLASAWRRGLAGVLAVVLAVLVCYGTLAGVVLLSLLGVNLILNESVWAGAIATLAVLAAAAVAPGMRRHRERGPTILAAAGAGVTALTLLLAYNPLVELIGLLSLAGAVYWDFRLRRRDEVRVLGLVGRSHGAARTARRRTSDLRR